MRESSSIPNPANATATHNSSRFSLAPQRSPASGRSSASTNRTEPARWIWRPQRSLASHRHTICPFRRSRSSRMMRASNFRNSPGLPRRMASFERRRLQHTRSRHRLEIFRNRAFGKHADALAALQRLDGHLQRIGEWAPEREDFTWLETASGLFNLLRLNLRAS